MCMESVHMCTQLVHNCTPNVHKRAPVRLVAASPASRGRFRTARGPNPAARAGEQTRQERGERQCLSSSNESKKPVSAARSAGSSGRSQVTVNT